METKLRSSDLLVSVLLYRSQNADVPFLVLAVCGAHLQVYSHQVFRLHFVLVIHNSASFTTVA